MCVGSFFALPHKSAGLLDWNWSPPLLFGFSGVDIYAIRFPSPDTKALPNNRSRAWPLIDFTYELYVWSSHVHAMAIDPSPKVVPPTDGGQ